MVLSRSEIMVMHGAPCAGIRDVPGGKSVGRRGFTDPIPKGCIRCRIRSIRLDMRGKKSTFPGHRHLCRMLCPTRPPARCGGSEFREKIPIQSCRSDPSSAHASIDAEEPSAMKLCGFRVSNYHNKVRIVLLEKGIEHEEDPTCFPSQKPEFLKRTPMEIGRAHV